MNSEYDETHMHLWADEEFPDRGYRLVWEDREEQTLEGACEDMILIASCGYRKDNAYLLSHFTTTLSEVTCMHCQAANNLDDPLWVTVQTQKLKNK